MVAKDGTVRHVLIDSSGLFHQGVFRHTRCFTRDVTELRASQEQVALVTRHTRDLVSLLDLQGRLVWASPSHAAVLGFAPEELVGTDALGLVHPEDLPAAQKALAELAPGRDARVRVRSRHKAGGWRWFDAHATLLEQDGRRLILASARDVSERQEAEEALRASEARWRAVAETAEDGIVTADGAGRIASFNRAAERLFGYAAEEVSGVPLSTLFSEGFDRALLAWTRPPAAPDGPAHGRTVELPGRRKDGTVVPLDLSLSTWQARGEVHVTAIVRDATERRRAQAARERLAAIVQGSEEAILSKDLRGVILTWNPAAERIFGYAAEEIVGRPVQLLVPPDRAREEEDILDRLRRGERIAPFESRRRCKDGRVIDVSLTLSPLLGPDGAVVGASTIARDITERKREGTLRRTAEERFERVFREGPIGMALVGPDLRPAMVNDALCRLLGATAEELAQETFPEFAPPEAGTAAGTAAGAAPPGSAREPPRSHQLEKRYLRKDGAVLWAHVTVSRLGAPGGGFTALAMLQDITARKQAEAALRASQAQLQAILDNSTTVVYLKRTDGRYLLINQRYAELFGVSKTAVVGRTDEDIFGPEFAAKFRANDLQVLEAGQALEFEEVAPHPDGPHTYISVKFPVRDGDGHVVATGGISTDITDRKRAEEAMQAVNEQLRQLDALKTHIINTASHELRTPLTPMALQLELLRASEPGLVEAQRGALEVLERNLQRLTRLIEDMLDVARLQSGHLTLRPERLDAAALLGEAAGSFAAMARKAGVALVVEAEGPLWVEGDGHRLTQVLYNLLSNALKFTPPAGRVAVRGRRVGAEVELAVEDSGAGLTPAQLGQLFAPFAQVHGAPRGRQGGTGLGLFISRGIVERHGGRLTAASAGPGQGATFVVTLPAAEPPGAPAPR